VKISTNTDLSRRKPQWIDFNAGTIVSDQRDMDNVADELLGYVLDVASGRERTRNETNGFREIAIWKDGVTL
jgi:altronate hydrolase